MILIREVEVKREDRCELDGDSMFELRDWIVFGGDGLLIGVILMEEIEYVLEICF